MPKLNYIFIESNQPSSQALFDLNKHINQLLTNEKYNPAKTASDFAVPHFIHTEVQN